MVKSKMVSVHTESEMLMTLNGPRIQDVLGELISMISLLRLQTSHLFTRMSS